MKKQNPLSAALPAIAGILLTAHAAKAAYTTGDLLLGFRATGNPGSTVDLLVDVGPVSQFTTTAAFTLSLGGLGTDLTSLFSQTSPTALDWFSRPDLYWSITGTDYDGGVQTIPRLFVTREETTPGTYSTPWKERSTIAQTSTVTLFQQLSGEFNNIGGIAAGAAAPNTSNAVIQGNIGAGTNSYSSFTAPALDFSVWTTVEGSFKNGPSGSVLDLYQLDPVANANGTRLGSFAINSAGTVNYTGTAAVPEPGSGVLTAAGLLLASFARRRSAKSPINHRSNRPTSNH